jgi:hypothetical protein
MYRYLTPKKSKISIHLTIKLRLELVIVADAAGEIILLPLELLFVLRKIVKQPSPSTIPANHAKSTSLTINLFIISSLLLPSVLSWEPCGPFRVPPIQHPPLCGLLILRTGSYLKADALSAELRGHINQKRWDVSTRVAVGVNRAVQLSLRGGRKARAADEKSGARRGLW